ncbi:hypothetical protein CEXT_291831 [Caerostris extrusa]|uniref:Uncharacterized protein n=1 Tax=Caerostris extrusa TaxID=172846 RepID=A0AAV4YCU0_CAEEX|nr:hypothetical protein CEXT_291831 [Caerostris extrusa]
MQEGILTSRLPEQTKHKEFLVKEPVLESDISFLPPFLLPPGTVVMQTTPRRNSDDKVNGSSHHSIKTLENTPGKRIRPFQWYGGFHRPLCSRTIT